MLRSFLGAAFRRTCWILPLVAAVSLLAQENQYEQRYGQPVVVRIDDLIEMPENYIGRAVVTSATLEMVTDTTSGSSMLLYALRGTFGGKLYLRPVPEAEARYEEDMRLWIGEEVEVTGAISQSTSTAQGVGGGVVTFMLVWRYLGPPSKKDVSANADGTTIEALVRKPEAWDGKLVSVIGQFRGSNLYGDLPSASRKRSDDWVIKDDLFAVWVTGKKPKGNGWSLDPKLKRDAGKWLRVRGRVRAGGGVVTLEAVAVEIAKASSSADEAKTSAEPVKQPRPMKPRHPPEIVFALPLDGELEVETNAVFKVQFNCDIDERTFSGRVILRYFGQPQPGDRGFGAAKMNYDLGRRTLTVDPGDLLMPGRVIELILLPGIVDLDGRPVITRAGSRNVPDGAIDVLRYRISTGY